MKAKDNEVIGGGGRADETVVNLSKLLKVKKSLKVEKPQKPEKSTKVIGLEKSSFSTFDIRLTVTKIGSRYTKLMMENYWPLLKPLRSRVTSTKFLC